MTEMVASKELREKLREFNQEHLLQYFNELEPNERAGLLAQLENIDLEALSGYFKKSQETSVGEKVDEALEPLEDDVMGGVNQSSSEDLERFRRIGLESISKGEVAVLLLAGGQGTRLGVNYPKGMYNVGLPSSKCLYQIQAERVSKIQTLASDMFHTNGLVPWYIMTSEATMEKTRDYFTTNEFFGLNTDDVIFFEQNTLPCLTFEGKIILESKSKIAVAPDGNGGLYKALNQNKIIEDMETRGVKYVHVYCVDNILIKMADPCFIGFCIHKNAECGAKIMKKSSPSEAVGVVGKVHGRYQTVEYSEITPKTAEMRLPDGTLKYNAANICNHFFTRDFLQDVITKYDDKLTHHVAKKKIPYLAETGERIKPTQPNGIKMEKFVFDVFPFCNRFCAWEVLRDEEFSPLKNADGAVDSTPTTCRHSLFRLHHRWICENGGTVSQADDTVLRSKRRKIGHTHNGVYIGSPSAVETNGFVEKAADTEPIVVEISPLVSYEGEGLKERVNTKAFTAPVIFN